jgi:uncharacterized membrane protein
VRRPALVLALLYSLAVITSAQRAAPPSGAPRPETAPAPPVPAAAEFDSIVKPFVAENCYPCHGNKKHEKDLNFQAFGSPASLIEHRERWEEVARKLRASEMPPIEEDQPPEDQRQAVATWLEREFERIDRVTPPDPGRVTARRLNRAEYDNTTRDTASTTSPTSCRCRRC